MSGSARCSYVTQTTVSPAGAGPGSAASPGGKSPGPRVSTSTSSMAVQATGAAVSPIASARSQRPAPLSLRMPVAVPSQQASGNETQSAVPSRSAV